MDSPGAESDILGQSLFQGLLQRFFPGFEYVPYFAAIAFSLKYVFEFWAESIMALVVSTVEVHSQDETYNHLMTWVSKNAVSRKNHRLRATTTVTNESFEWGEDDGKNKYDNDTFDESDLIGDDLKSRIALYNTRPIHWTPAMGTHFFWYKGRLLAFTRALEERTQSSLRRQPEKLTISCLGRDATVLKQLLLSARSDFLDKEKGRTGIFRATRSYEDEMEWTRCMSRTTRPISSIAMEETLKQGLVKDMERYLDPHTKSWYANRGIPYRRGYLFSGPPGTGKTSLTLAAAGAMGLDIYIINLNSARLNEDNLSHLFQKLPFSCLVLLEDIDAMGLAHKRSAETGKTNSRRGKDERISLSGLLNVIDGAAAQEGRVLVMTSNHTGNIDPALLRPGRIDHTVQFGLASAKTAQTLFKHMFQGVDIDLKRKNSSLQSQAVKFGHKIPDFAISPAAIQGFLLQHQGNPKMALAGVDAWVQQISANKETETSLLGSQLENDGMSSEGTDDTGGGDESGESGEEGV